MDKLIRWIHLWVSELCSCKLAKLSTMLPKYLLGSDHSYNTMYKIKKEIKDRKKQQNQYFMSFSFFSFLIQSHILFKWGILNGTNLLINPKNISNEMCI